MMTNYFFIISSWIALLTHKSTRTGHADDAQRAGVHKSKNRRQSVVKVNARQYTEPGNVTPKAKVTPRKENSKVRMCVGGSSCCARPPRLFFIIVNAYSVWNLQPLAHDAFTFMLLPYVIYASIFQSSVL